MKKISLIIITIITLSSCSTQIITGTSFKEYNHSINDVSIDLLNNGYELVNHNTGTNTNSTFIETHSNSRNNTNINGNTYTTPNYFSTNNENNYNINSSKNNNSYTEITNLVDTYDYYTFSNKKGDIVEINMKYKVREFESTTYLRKVELLGCKTSNPYDYEKICGDNSMIQRKLENIEEDLSFELVDYSGLSILAALMLGLSAIAPLFFL